MIDIPQFLKVLVLAVFAGNPVKQQIKKELGISEKNNKENIFYKETKELRELWREKPYYSEHNRLRAGTFSCRCIFPRVCLDVQTRSIN